MAGPRDPLHEWFLEVGMKHHGANFLDPNEWPEDESYPYDLIGEQDDDEQTWEE